MSHDGSERRSDTFTAFTARRTDDDVVVKFGFGIAQKDTWKSEARSMRTEWFIAS